MTRFRRLIATVLAACIGCFGTVQSAQATLIGTEQVAQSQGMVPARSVDDARALLDATLRRADVAAALQERGVDPAQAQARVAALTDAEAQAMAAQIDAAPAGAGVGVIGVIVFIFVLLLITDILGFTKIFPFTRSIR